MKSIVYLLIFHLSAISFAQDPQLFENTWYLHEMFIEDIHFIPPTNNEIEYVPLYFDEPNSMETSACYVMTASLNFIGSGQFALFDGGMTLQGCENPENNDFGNYYMIDFWEDNFDEIFDYSISVEGSRKTLIIFNASNSVAIYSNVMLSTEKFNDFQFALYPNPTTGMLNVEGNVHIKKVTVYDLLGRNVLETESMAQKIQVNLNHLKAGVYFAEITSEGKRTVRKIVKK